MRSMTLVLGAALLLLFANGRHTIPMAAWLAPLVLLRFVRAQKTGRGLLVAWIVLSATWAFQFRGMAPLPGIWYYVLAASYGLVLVIPFIADRILAPRIGGFAGTLVLPCAWVAVEFAVAGLVPYGSWGSAAYSQHESLVLLQLVSVTGIYGVSFLIAWTAAIGNRLLDANWNLREVRRGAAVSVSVVVAVLFFGGARLVLFPPSAETVRVASLSAAEIDLFPTQEFAMRALNGQLTAEETEEVRRRGGAINDDLLERAEREARAGARIVFFGEANAFSFKEDESELIRRGMALARASSIYLGLAVATWNGEAEKPLENKVVLIDPTGAVRWEFWKAIPVPGAEAAISALDDGLIDVADTPYGKIGGAICFDMDFPNLLEQAGQQQADLMLVPSNDWREIDPWHSHMARLRAVEQGFNMVRHTSHGLSLAADYQGRVLSSMDHYTTTDRVLISQVPTSGTRTVYARIGDTFAWLCVAGLLVVAATGVRSSRSPVVS